MLAPGDFRGGREMERIARRWWLVFASVFAVKAGYVSTGIVHPAKIVARVGINAVDVGPCLPCQQRGRVLKEQHIRHGTGLAVALQLEEGKAMFAHIGAG